LLFFLESILERVFGSWIGGEGDTATRTHSFFLSFVALLVSTWRYCGLMRYPGVRMGGVRVTQSMIARFTNYFAAQVLHPVNTKSNLFTIFLRSALSRWSNPVLLLQRTVDRINVNTVSCERTHASWSFVHNMRIFRGKWCYSSMASREP